MPATPPTDAKPARQPAKKAKSVQRKQVDPAKQATPKKKVAAKKREVEAEPEEQLPPSKSMAWLTNSPPWLVSTVVHIVILVALGLFSIATLPEAQYDIMSAFESDVEEDVVELTPVDLEFEEIEIEEVVPNEMQPVDMSDVMAEAMASMEVSDMALDTGLASDLLGQGFGDGMGDGQGDGDGKGQMSSFFGTKSRGDRVVYIVDASNSMTQGRMQTTLMEIMRSVEAMNKKQQFYVIMYSDQAYPMFFPTPIDEMLYANKQNKYKLGQWFNTIETCLGGQVLEAVELAAKFRPQVIYLLSDGRIPTQLVEAAKEPNNWRFTINTFGMTAPESGKANLTSLAKKFNGTYRDVGVNPVAAELAKKNPIKKNNKPGGVWGSRIGMKNKKK